LSHGDHPEEAELMLKNMRMGANLP
jgi:hypothetical protein